MWGDDMKYDKNKTSGIICLALGVLLLGVICVDYFVNRRAETIVVTKSEIEQSRENRQSPEDDDDYRTIAAQYDDLSVIVYVSLSGRYHFTSDCSSMKEYTEMPLGKAIFMGYSACSRCDLIVA